MSLHYGAAPHTSSCEESSLIENTQQGKKLFHTAFSRHKVAAIVSLYLLCGCVAYVGKNYYTASGGLIVGKNGEPVDILSPGVSIYK